MTCPLADKCPFYSSGTEYFRKTCDELWEKCIFYRKCSTEDNPCRCLSISYDMYEYITEKYIELSKINKE